MATEKLSDDRFQCVCKPSDKARWLACARAAERSLGSWARVALNEKAAAERQAAEENP